MTAPARPPLPALLRLGTLTALVLGAIISWASARDVAMVLMAPTAEVPEEFPNVFQSLMPDPRAATEATKAMMRSQLQALESMRGPRLAILLLLSTASALVFVSALRLRWPSGVARPGVARLLGASAIACAILRTLDGAQLLVVARRGAASWDKVMAKSEVLRGAQVPEGFNVFLMSAASVGLTLAMAGAFVALGMYFRSPHVGELLAQDDARLTGGGQG